MIFKLTKAIGSLGLFLASVAVVVNVGVVVDAVTPTIRYDCDPCLDRSTYRVEAIFHGTKSDPFWQQVSAAATQAAKDMDIELDIKLYNKFDLTEMIDDINNVPGTGGEDEPDVLIVTLPSDDVVDAVKDVIDAGIPVIGMNAGSTKGKDIGVLDFVGPNDVEGGKLAGTTIIQMAISTTLSNVLFVNDEEGNVATSERLTGFKSAFDATVTVDEVVINGSMDTSSMTSTLSSKLSGGCPYQAILLSGTRTVQAATEAVTTAGCSSNLIMGSFDTSTSVFDAIGSNKVSFTIDNQQYLQGALTTVLASLVATTGKSLASSAEVDSSGAYLTGPKVITKSTLPTDTRKECMNDAFPVCPMNKAPDGVSDATCECTERKKIKIGGVTHGITTDSFWDPVYAASKQAAFDMDVELYNERWEPEDNEETLHIKMASRISDLCTNVGVDGIFVSIPSDKVIDAIKECQALNIPVMSVNAGATTSKDLGLMHHIGMLEYNAGYGAGEYLVANTDMTRGICINHAEGVNVVEERCAGFGDAIQAAGKTYLGQVYVPSDNTPLYISNTEEFVNEDGDWDNMGILAAGGPQHVPVIALQARRPNAIIGAFDVSLDLYEAVDQGIKEFGIDQQAYMQGYMPVVLLTYAVSTGVGQTVFNQVVESGPAFISSSPSNEQQVCEDTMFVTCEEKLVDDNFVSPNIGDDSSGAFNKESRDYITGLIVGVAATIAASIVG